MCAHLMKQALSDIPVGSVLFILENNISVCLVQHQGTINYIQPGLPGRKLCIIVLSKISCPGQDTRYWKPGDIFERPCTSCGRPVEFFKDDLRRKCPACGEYTINPNNDLSCAQWCLHAKECLEQNGITLDIDE